MSNNPANMDRRKALSLIAGAAVAVPLATLIGSRNVLASDLPHVTADDPIAAGLKYQGDATQAARTDKAGVAADQQFCGGCQFSQGDGEWLPCSLFPGKSVNANGWCSAWAPRAS